MLIVTIFIIPFPFCILTIDIDMNLASGWSKSKILCENFLKGVKFVKNQRAPQITTYPDCTGNRYQYYRPGLFLQTDFA